MDEIEKGYRFREPAAETRQYMKETNIKINDMTLNLQSMKDKIDVLGEKMDKNEKQHVEILGKMDKFIEAADKKYASKEIETFLKKINWLIISSVIVGLLGLFILFAHYFSIKL